MTIYLLDGTLQIDIFFECEDHDLEDNICISIIERCPPNERLLRAGQTNIFLTPQQARTLGEALINSAANSETMHKE
jgi:hypothetical protein